MTNPMLNPAVGTIATDEGYVAYNPGSDRLYTMNGQGALIAELCDGSRSVDELRALVGPLLPEGQSADVGRWIDDGIDTGLLVWADGSTGAPREFSTGELINLAIRFSEYGSGQTAIVFAKRATEVNPEDPNAWHALGRAAGTAGLHDLRRDAYEKYLNCGVEDPVIFHQLAALRGDSPPRMPDDCVRMTFDNFSPVYDKRMRDQLSYQAPERLQDLIRSEMGDAAGLEILDIGCGTGLVGIGLKGWAAGMTGIDLSPKMIELARERGIYDRLEVAEIVDWLGQAQGQFDLIASCDCLIYFGDLGPVASGAARRLKPGGLFGFSVERGERYPFELTPSGRYTHHPEHVREVAKQAGLIVVRLEEGFLRNELGLPVTGLYALLRKPGDA
jgi:predicted TPR repeat methyltransferase